jgi:hypothetical protein
VDPMALAASTTSSGVVSSVGGGTSGTGAAGGIDGFCMRCKGKE